MTCPGHDVERGVGADGGGHGGRDQRVSGVLFAGHNGHRHHHPGETVPQRQLNTLAQSPQLPGHLRSRPEPVPTSALPVEPGEQRPGQPPLQEGFGAVCLNPRGQLVILEAAAVPGGLVCDPCRGGDEGQLVDHGGVIDCDLQRKPATHRVAGPGAAALPGQVSGGLVKVESERDGQRLSLTTGGKGIDDVCPGGWGLGEAGNQEIGVIFGHEASPLEGRLIVGACLRNSPVLRQYRVRMEVTHTGFGLAADRAPVDLFTIGNGQGMTVELISLGATVKSVSVPDRDDRVADVALGLPSLAGYLGNHPYFGSTVGRVGNRIGGAAFQLDGEVHRLEANDGPNHLHGGVVGFSRAVWEAEPFESEGEAGVSFRLVSPDGDQRYPGNLAVEARYSLTETGELIMAFEATTDRPTPVNLLNHTYWNLSGEGDVLDHLLSVEADHYLPVDATQIPTGAIAPVAGTALDFTAPKAVGQDFDDVPGDRAGYDHCYVLRHRSALGPAARLWHEGSGRVMEVTTSQPGLQLYTGNNLSGFEPHGGHGRFEGLCLETQHFPDSPNRPEFPSTVLEPGERYAQLTIHRFSIE